MKQYQITFNVPDDFQPDELSLSANYDRGENEISIAEEGFTEESEEIGKIWEELQTLIKEKLDLKVDTVPENSVVRITFPPEAVADYQALTSLNILKDAVESTYKCPCIIYCGTLEVMVENADDAIKMLNGMIAKIKTRAAVKDTSGIVLPK